MELRFNFKIFGSNTLLNYHFFQQFKLVKRDKFNNLINILTYLYRLSGTGYAIYEREKWVDETN